MTNSTHTIPRHENLVRHLATALLAGDVTDLSRHCIIVPNQRLQPYILRELATHQPAFIPPRILTLESFGKLLPRQRIRRIISGVEQQIFLNAIIAQVKPHYARAGQERDILRFFEEIMDADLGAQAFAMIKSKLAEDPFRDDRHIDRLLDQIDELHDLFTRYQEFLRAKGLSDAPTDFRERVHAYLADSQSAIHNFAEQFYIAGFVDGSPLQCKFIKKFLTETSAILYLHTDAALLAPSPTEANAALPTTVLQHFLRGIGASTASSTVGRKATPNTRLARAVFSLKTDELQPDSEQVTLHVHTAPAPLAEIKSAVALARRYVHDHNISPNDIIFAVPDEQMYGSLLWAACQEASVPCNFALGIPLSRTQIGQWLQLLVAIVQNDGRLTTLLDLFNNGVYPYWHAQHELPGSAVEIQTSLQTLASDRGITSGLDTLMELATSHSNEELITFLQTMQSTLAPIIHKAERSLSEWTSALWQFSERTAIDRYLQNISADAYNLETRAHRAWYLGLQQFARAGENMRDEIGLPAVLRLLNQSVLSTKIRPAGEPFVGVQIMGLLEARSVPVRVLIVLGNSEGIFPGSPGRELFIPEVVRRELQLTTFQKFEQLQDLQFYHLLASAPQVHLFASTNKHEMPLVPSRYLQRIDMLNELGAPGIVAVPSENHLLRSDYLTHFQSEALPAALADQQKRVRAEAQQRGDLRGDLSGERAALFSTFTATLVESLLKCPYQFLLKKARIGEIELPDDDLDHRAIGEWLHAVCQYFFQGLPHQLRATLADPGTDDLFESWSGPISDNNRARALQRLVKLTSILLPHFGGRFEFLYQMTNIGWPQFIDAELSRPTTAEYENLLELVIDETLPELEAHFRTPVTIRGRIDRICSSNTHAHIIDYKLSGVHESVKKLKQGEKPQLAIYAELLRHNPQFAHISRWSAEYLGLKNGKQTALNKAAVDRDLQAAWDSVRDRLIARADQLLSAAGNFEPEIDPNFCKLCHFAGICRKAESHYNAHHDAAAKDEA